MRYFKGRLAENIFSMLTLRGLEYVLALALIPYLVRVLGPERFGAVAFMQGLVQYCNLVVDYGFNLTAPRDIAQADKNDWPRLFSSFMAAKVLLLLVVTMLAVVLYFVLAAFCIFLDVPLFWAVYTLVLGNILFPIWFFQGIQEMRYITIMNVIGRVVTTAGIFLLVSSPADYVAAAFFQAATPLVAGAASLWWLFRHYPSLWVRPSWGNICHAYREGWNIFLSTVAINFYTASNVVILGFLTNNTVVGYYSSAAKLIDCVKRLMDPVSQAVYPHISRLMGESKEKGFQFLHKMLLLFASGGILLFLVVLFGAPFIVHLILGGQYEAAVLPLQIMAMVPLMVAMSNIFGIQIMLPLGMEKTFSRILMVSAVVNTLCIIPLSLWQGAAGTALTMAITETFVTVTMGYILWKKNILFR